MLILQEQKEYTGLPLTLRVQDILYKSTEQESKKSERAGQTRDDEDRLNTINILNTVKMKLYHV